jgi:hypothetical protein
VRLCARWTTRPGRGNAPQSAHPRRGPRRACATGCPVSGEPGPRRWLLDSRVRGNERNERRATCLPKPNPLVPAFATRSRGRLPSSLFSPGVCAAAACLLCKLATEETIARREHAVATLGEDGMPALSASASASGLRTRTPVQGSRRPVLPENGIRPVGSARAPTAYPGSWYTLVRELQAGRAAVLALTAAVLGSASEHCEPMRLFDPGGRTNEGRKHNGFRPTRLSPLKCGCPLAKFCCPLR